MKCGCMRDERQSWLDDACTLIPSQQKSQLEETGEGSGGAHPQQRITTSTRPPCQPTNYLLQASFLLRDDKSYHPLQYTVLSW